MKNIFCLIVFAAFFILGCGKSYKDHSFTKETIQYKSISGVPENQLSLDLYHYDDQKSHPVLFWVHGGGWAIGDKENRMEDKLKWAYKNDYIFISTNYRLTDSDVPLSDTGRIEFPDHPNDVADALKWTYESIDTYGGNSDQLLIFGHSAGAHLVSLLGTDTSYLSQRNLPLDLIKGVGSFDTQALNIPKLLSETPHDLYINAFGNDETLWPKASPFDQLSNHPAPPQFFIVTRGSKQREGFANNFNDKLKSNGYTSQIINATPYSHRDVNKKIGTKNEDKFMDEFDAFLKKLF